MTNIQDGVRDLLSLYMNFQSGKMKIKYTNWKLDDFAQYITEFAQQKLWPSDRQITIELCSHRALKHMEFIHEFSQNLVDHLNKEYHRNITSYQVISNHGTLSIYLTVTYRKFVHIQNLLNRYTRFALSGVTHLTFNRRSYTLRDYTGRIVDFSRVKSPEVEANHTKNVVFFNEDHFINRNQMTNFGALLVSELNDNNKQNVLDYSIERNTDGKQELILKRSDRRWLKKYGPHRFPENFREARDDYDTDIDLSTCVSRDVYSIMKSLNTRLEFLENSTRSMC